MIEASAVADRLRTLADWLDAHPSAVVSVVSTYAEPWRVDSFGLDTEREIRNAARTLDPGEWQRSSGQHSFRLSREVVPGISFEFFLSRAKADEIATAA